MARTRPNYQTSEIVPYGERRLLRPPDSLSDAARRAFIDLVASVPASHFKPGDVSLLCRYAEVAALAERAAFELEQPNGTVTVDGKVSAWFSVHATATKSLSGLALRLRLGPHSRALKASKKEAGPPMSAYERMRLDPKWIP